MRKSPRRGAITPRVLIALLATVMLAMPATAAELRLTVNGIHSDNGEILIALFDNPAGFQSAISNAAIRGLMPDSGRLIGTSLRARRGSQSTVFTQLPPGRYAVIIVHDENDNGRLDKDFMGVPTEGYGFGNDAQGFLSAPSFDAAAITVGTGNTSASINLLYPSGSSTQGSGTSRKIPGR